MERLGELPGRGSVGRGRSDAPLFFGDEKDLGTDNVESVSGDNMERALPGEVLAVGQMEHDDDTPASVRQAGGELAREAQGGKAVWKDSLMPSEKSVLKRYFD